MKSLLKHVIILFFLFSCLGNFVVFPQIQNLKIKPFVGHHVLESSQINCIYQDNMGFMWFGTNNGLLRFDGYDFIHYKNIPWDSTSLSSSIIKDIDEDVYGNLWIATKGGGLNKFSRSLNSFRSWVYRQGKDGMMPENNVNAIAIDKWGNIYIGIAFRGLVKYNPASKTHCLIQFKKDSDSNGILTLFIDSKNRLWVSQFSQGTYMLDLNKYKDSEIKPEDFKCFKHLQGEKGQIHSIFETKNKTLWYADKKKLARFDEKKKQFTSIHIPEKIRNNQNISDVVPTNDSVFIVSTQKHLFMLLFSESYNKYTVKEIDPMFSKTEPANLDILKIFIDNAGGIWIGSNLKLFYAKESHFKTLVPYNNLNKRNTVNCIAQYDDNRLILGMWDEEMLIYNKNTNEYLKYHTKPAISRRVISIHRDISDNLWIGTWDGLFSLNPSGNLNPGFTSNPFKNIVRNIEEDKNGNILIACWGDTENGLIRINQHTGQIKFFSAGDGKLSNYSLNTVCIDKKGIIWAGTIRHGLNKIEKQKDGTYSYTNYLYSPYEPASISGNNIQVIYEDSEERLWIGTENGLSLMDRNSESFRSFYQADGLHGNAVINIIEDNQNDLWVTTRTGLYKLGTQTMEIRSFNNDNNIDLKIFTPQSAYKGSDGKLYFGGEGGFISFSPKDISISTDQPKVVFTNFWLYNEEVKPGKPLSDGRVLLKDDIPNTKRIQLNYDDKIISFSFAALEFTYPQSIMYEYRLKNFDETWIQTDADHRRIVYTGLEEGEYTLEVRARNKNQVLGKKYAKLEIVVAPPFWRTFWFRGGIVLFITVLIYLFLNIRVSFLKRQRKKLQNIVNERTNELSLAYQEIKIQKQEVENLSQKEKEVNKMRLRFFTNISHEFRTPLSLIVAPLEELIQNEKGLYKNKLFLIKKNVDSLLSLIDQLLDFRKIESKQLPLSVQKGNITKFVKNIFNLFVDMAASKNIKYTVETNIEDPEIYFDHDKVYKILINLISNAVKYTPNNEYINLRVAKPDNNLIQVQVENSGVYITKEKINRIFDRFYVLDELHGKQYGSGIGLAFVKELISLHRGKIWVEQPSEFTNRFVFELPVAKKDYLENEISQNSSYIQLQKLIVNEQDDLSEEIQPAEEADKIFSPGGEKKPLLLLVEDDRSIRDYLSSYLASLFYIETATNGKEGLDIALRKKPKFIISDVMMPEMGGLELCQILKMDIRTSHIPVILLTAKTEFESKKSGIIYGADDYITKPFSPQFLKLRITKILENRKKLQQYLMKETVPVLQNFSFDPVDKRFLEQLHQVIEQNLDNPDFYFKYITNEIGISRSVLYEKVKALTGVSVNGYIRSIRLKAAEKLLKESKYNISEIIYKTGFNSESHFRKCFKETYQLSPLDYRKKYQISQ